MGVVNILYRDRDQIRDQDGTGAPHGSDATSTPRDRDDGSGDLPLSTISAPRLLATRGKTLVDAVLTRSHADSRMMSSVGRTREETSS